MGPSPGLYDCIIVDEAHRGYLLDAELREEDLTFRTLDEYLSQYRRVLDYFDAVKIGLTATPAFHTTPIFGPPVFSCGYRHAVAAEAPASEILPDAPCKTPIFAARDNTPTCWLQNCAARSSPHTGRSRAIWCSRSPAIRPSATKWLGAVAAEQRKAVQLIDRPDQSLLAKAFRGALVPQDPDDEPVSVFGVPGNSATASARRLITAAQRGPHRKGRQIADPPDFCGLDEKQSDSGDRQAASERGQFTPPHWRLGHIMLTTARPDRNFLSSPIRIEGCNANRLVRPMPPPLKLPQFRAIFACVASEGGEIACSSYPSINSLFGSEIPLLALAQFPASLHGNLLGFPA